MIEIVFAILMIQNGKVIEYVPTGGMADCLEQKRIVTRQIGEEQEGWVRLERACVGDESHLDPPTRTLHAQLNVSQRAAVHRLVIRGEIAKMRELACERIHARVDGWVVRAVAALVCSTR